MAQLRIRTQSYFDGHAAHGPKDGPYLITIDDGRIRAIDRRATDVPFDVDAPFVMPGLVEAHAHLFLDGGELDFDKRNAYLGAGRTEMMAVAHQNISLAERAGVTLVRDAGDRYGINDSIRAEQAASTTAHVVVRSPGLGLKRPKRYGAFMARDIEPGGDVVAAVDELAATADDIKIILTGIIDFVAGEVKGAPQFDEAELGAIVGRRMRAAEDLCPLQRSRGAEGRGRGRRRFH